eukprot:TRINITY_DN62148_c0_g1_i1.p1 TRINITY_DN62148_c0_g1~~TRINITY_DN62148_c0_g1_i1.p1  ORF type:complete len:431 (-),score=68.26 TRINITY_DN62148_c0_g1_i1:16-1308(-)
MFSDQSIGHDIMGIHGDILFADPLGVRGDSSKAKGSSGGVGGPRGSRGGDVSGYGAPNAASGDLSRGRHDPSYGQSRSSQPQKQETTIDQRQPSFPSNAEGASKPTRQTAPGMSALEDDSSWLSTVNSALLSMLAGGRQCCSMRERGDVEAARKASAIGRPPPRTKSDDDGEQREGKASSSIFPHPSEGSDDEDQRPTFQGVREDRPTDAARFNAQKVASDSLDQGKNPPLVPKNSGSFDVERKRGRTLDIPADFLRGDDDDDVATPAPAPATASRQSPEPPRPPTTTFVKEEPIHELEKTLAAKRGLPKNWKWPAFCLDSKNPCIEVYVDDEDTGTGKWCHAEPQFRVVDDDRNDAYLCAEYQWDDGDCYTQDFAPEHVRRKGTTISIRDMLIQGREGPAKQEARPKVTSTQSRQDSGGGVSNFLDDSF